MSMQRRVRTAIHSPLPTFEPVHMVSKSGARALAALRVTAGFVFLWAFLDKTFGLHYSTPGSRAWIHGGSPTRGFLKSVAVGPLRSAFHSMAGTWWADWLFMLGLAGVGVALIAGVAVRAAAFAGGALLALMWLSEFPPAQHTHLGAASGSTNPLVDYHFVYAMVLVALATTYSGARYGLGRAWAKLPMVHRHPWLL